VLFSLLAVLWTPWERVHPLDATLHEAIGYAPFWSQRFAKVLGARVDWASAGIAVATVWAMCAVAALILGMSAKRD
jgi:hypothetical protein